ncbi:MAG: hypothetical protein IRZ15_12100 [Bryobacteraceae bacterium]|nr:hypothetical protein [Bryobacteraceae bacterium]
MQGMVPAGTQLVVRTNETISTRTATPGQAYSAEITRDVVDQTGQVIIPAGSPAELTVVQTGDNQLSLALRSVTVRGNTYAVTTPMIEERGTGGLGWNRRTLAFVGGGAVLGTLIGAVAGGGTGAGIGAIVGGAGGALAQVLTRGDEIRVPAETELTFQLDQPVCIQGYRR